MPSYWPSPFSTHSTWKPSRSKALFQESSPSPAISLLAWSPATIISGSSATRPAPEARTIASTSSSEGVASTVPMKMFWSPAAATCRWSFA